MYMDGEDISLLFHFKGLLDQLGESTAIILQAELYPRDVRSFATNERLGVVPREKEGLMTLTEFSNRQVTCS